MLQIMKVSTWLGYWYWRSVDNLGLGSFDDNTRLLKAYEDRDANLAAALIRSNHMNALAALEKCLANANNATTLKGRAKDI